MAAVAAAPCMSGSASIRYTPPAVYVMPVVFIRYTPDRQTDRQTDRQIDRQPAFFQHLSVQADGGH